MWAIYYIEIKPEKINYVCSNLFKNNTGTSITR